MKLFKQCLIEGCGKNRPGDYTRLCNGHRNEWLSERWEANRWSEFLAAQAEQIANPSLWPYWR